MNEMQVFQNSEFGELGVLEIDGKPYFPAKAAAKILGYKDTTNAIKQHCKGVVKHHLPTNGGLQTVNFIPEGDLYRLIVHSKLPAAERFEKWVFDEVLPTIRKTGGYGSQQAMMGKMLDQIARITENLMQVTTMLTKTIEVIAGTAPLCGSVPKGICGEKAVSPAPSLCGEQPAEGYAASREEVRAAMEAARLRGRDYGKSAAECRAACNSTLKLETFPPELVAQVDAMMEDMIRMQELNYSLIARFCTINGYAISSPAVKNYYQRHFSDD